MKYFEVFAGIGGFAHGIQNAFTKLCEADGEDAAVRHQPDDTGIVPQEGRQCPVCVGYSEIDKYAISVYEKHFKVVKNYGDITKINAEELPDFDCLVGGFPCQAFSIAGKRRGFADIRGTLFFDLARIMQIKRPRLFVFENVKGLLRYDDGRTFKTIIQTITELGYDCQWSMCNSKDFGVPQNRERVIIVGHLRGTPRPEVFPLYGDSDKDIKQIIGGSQGYRVYETEGIAVTQASRAGGLGAKTGLYRIAQGGQHQPNIVAQRGRGKNNTQTLEPRKDNITNSLTSVQKDNLVTKTVRNGGRNSPHGCKQNWDSYEFDGQIRRLTPLECERLQGFPDCWTLYGVDAEGCAVQTSDSQRYKMCGNAVTTNVIQAVFERIL